jgi:hypothetical protein
MSNIAENPRGYSSLGGVEAAAVTPDVWWGSDGIDALIWPKPYAVWQLEEAAQSDRAVVRKETRCPRH